SLSSPAASRGCGPHPSLLFSPICGVSGKRRASVRTYHRGFGPGLIEGHIVVHQKVDLLEQPYAIATNVLFVVVPEEPAAHPLALFHHGTGHEDAPLADRAVAVHVDDEIHSKMGGKDDLGGDVAEE